MIAPLQGESNVPWDKEHDIVVIGSGPAGEGATMRAAKAGAKVVVVERYHEVGGGCTHWATIPSKALRHSVNELLRVRKSPLFAPLGGPKAFLRSIVYRGPQSLTPLYSVSGAPKPFSAL